MASIQSNGVLNYTLNQGEAVTGILIDCSTADLSKLKFSSDNFFKNEIDASQLLDYLKNNNSGRVNVESLNTQFLLALETPFQAGDTEYIQITNLGAAIAKVALLKGLAISVESIQFESWSAPRTEMVNNLDYVHSTETIRTTGTVNMTDLDVEKIDGKFVIQNLIDFDGILTTNGSAFLVKKNMTKKVLAQASAMEAIKEAKIANVIEKK